MGNKIIEDPQQIALSIMNFLPFYTPAHPGEPIIGRCPLGLPPEFNEFLHAVNTLKNGKASGIDGCSIKLLKFLIKSGKEPN